MQAYLKHCLHYILDHCGEDLDFFSKANDAQLVQRLQVDNSNSKDRIYLVPMVCMFTDCISDKLPYAACHQCHLMVLAVACTLHARVSLLTMHLFSQDHTAARWLNAGRLMQKW